jgi:hypothetical protein
MCEAGCLARDDTQMSKIIFAIIALVAVVGNASAAGLFADPGQVQIDAINKAFDAQGVSEDVAVINEGELEVIFVNKGEVDENKALEIILASNKVVGVLPEVNDILVINVHIVNSDGSKVADGFIFPNSVKSKSGVDLAQGIIDGSIIYV